MAKLLRGGLINSPTQEPISDQIPRQLEEEATPVQENKNAKKGSLKLLRGGVVQTQQKEQEPIMQNMNDTQSIYPQDNQLSQTNMTPEQMSQSAAEGRRIGAGLIGSSAQGLTSLPELAGTLLGRGAESVVNNLGLNNIQTGSPQHYPGYNPSENVYDSPEFKRSIEENRDIGAKNLVGRALGYDNLDPHSYIESLAQGVAEDLPNMLLTGGGSLLSKAGRSLASNIGSKGAKQLGLGPMFQIVAGLGTGTFVNYLSKYGVGGVTSKAKALSDSLFNKWDKYAPKAKVPNAPYTDILTNASKNTSNILVDDRDKIERNVKDWMEKLGGKQVAKKSKKAIESSIDYKDPKQLQKLIASETKKAPKETNYKDIVDVRRLIGKAQGAAKDSDERSFYKNLYAQFSDKLDDAAKTNTNVSDFLKAQSLDLGVKGSGMLRKIAMRDKSISKIFTSLPEMATLFGIPAAVGGANKILGLAGMSLPLGAKTVAVGTLAAPLIARSINLMRSPETRILVKQAIHDAALGDKASLIQNLKALGQNITNQQDSQPIESTENPYAKFL